VPVALGTPELVRDFSPSFRYGFSKPSLPSSWFFVVFATAVDDRGTYRSIAGFGIGLNH